MSELLNTFTNQFGGELLDAISGQVGLDKSQTGSVLGSALPIMVGALARNSSNPQGAEDLGGALDRDHDGSILDDLGGFLSDASGGGGAGILKHVLGGGRTGVEQALSKQTGVDTNSIANILEIAAPILMGILGKQKRNNHLGAGNIADLLQSSTQEITRQSPQGSSLINQLLDQDGDGNIEDDVTKMGLDLLGKFLK